MKYSINLQPSRFFPLILLILFLWSCKNRENGQVNNDHTLPDNRTKQDFYFIESPETNALFKPGDELRLRIEAEQNAPSVDSMQVYLNKQKLFSVMNTVESISVPTDGVPPGTSRLQARIYYGDSLMRSIGVTIRFLSDIVPDRYTYNLVREYPHDRTAYTQGLEYGDGFIYEGTGSYGKSSLRKSILQTGEIVKFRSLDPELFGEGITRLNGKIYQITYKSQVGFVYDEDNFELLQKIYYQNQEGWGLANDGNRIIMSDGTNIIYFMDTTYFSVGQKIEVYDHEGPVSQLNELEWIKGKIYANRYTTDEIVIIDPASGKVEGRIELSGLLKPEDRHPNIDFLNGIAWDRQLDRIFVTGKNWPKLFEVKFSKIQ